MKAFLIATCGFIFVTGIGYARTDTLKAVCSEIHFICDTMPQFPGGDAKLLNYIQKNIRYPSNDSSTCVYSYGNGSLVIVTFVIDKMGVPQDFKILRGPTNSINLEVIRVLKTMPVWKPGYLRGKPVCVQFNIPIRWCPIR